jgi:hypothetical protein
LPRAPRLDGYFDLRYITNYFVAGCVPPTYAVVDFSKEPLTDVAMLICTFDWQDIAQEVIQPGGRRAEKPGRHGRKGPKPVFGLDINEKIGAKIRAKVNPIDVMKHSPLRRIFPIWNAYEGVSFTAAVAEGFTDVGFETLWGLINIDPNHCREFPRVQRHREDPNPWDGQTIAAVGPPLNTFNMPILDSANQFLTVPTGVNCMQYSYELAVTVKIYVPYTVTPPWRGRLAIGRGATEPVWVSGELEGVEGDIISADVYGSGQADEWLYWGLTNRESHCQIFDAKAVAFANLPIFQ